MSLLLTSTRNLVREREGGLLCLNQVLPARGHDALLPDLSSGRSVLCLHQPGPLRPPESQHPAGIQKYPPQPLQSSGTVQVKTGTARDN